MYPRQQVIIYTTESLLHNETETNTYSFSERCRKLVRLARKYDVLLFTEDVYNLLCYEGKCPPRLLFYDDK